MVVMTVVDKEKKLQSVELLPQVMLSVGLPQLVEVNLGAIVRK